MIVGCILDEALSGESMAIPVINKINSRLRFLYRQNRILNVSLRTLLCNAMIQPFFDNVGQKALSYAVPHCGTI